MMLTLLVHGPHSERKRCETLKTECCPLNVTIIVIVMAVIVTWPFQTGT